MQPSPRAETVKGPSLRFCIFLPRVASDSIRYFSAGSFHAWEPRIKIRGSAVQGRTAIFNDGLVIENVRKAKTTLFAFRHLKGPGWTYQSYLRQKRQAVRIPNLFTQRVGTPCAISGIMAPHRSYP